MEDSREGKEDDEKGRRMPNSHVDDEKGKKPWYIRGGKTEEKGDGKKKRKNTTGEEKENHISRACPKRLIARFHDRILNLFTLNPIFWPKIRLAFFPALYKFIVWATWALIHSRFGFKSNLVPTNTNSDS